MICRYGRQAVLVGVVMFLTFFHGAQLWAADRAVTGVVVESGFTGVIVKAAGDLRAVKYQTGRGTVFAPANYRPVAGDTVTVRFYNKFRASGKEALVASAVSLQRNDPPRQEISSPAVGFVRRVGWRRIRFEFPAIGQVITMEMKRGMKKTPAHWRPAVGNKVRVHYDRVRARFGRRMVMVISQMENLD